MKITLKFNFQFEIQFQILIQKFKLKIIYFKFTNRGNFKINKNLKLNLDFSLKN